jgi:glycogen(starch) synthase
VRVLAVGSMYPPHHLGGYELIWESGMELLRDAGHDVAVLTTDYEIASPEPRADPGFPVWRELGWYFRDHGFPRFSAGERLLIEQVRRAGIPSVAAMCDDWFAYAAEVDAWTRAFSSRPRLGRVAEAVTGLPTRADLSTAIASWVFLSEELAGRAPAAGLEPRAARVAPRGADPMFRVAGRSEHPPWRWRLVYLGRIDARKGVDLAIEALALLPDEATLTIVGGGDDAELARLRALAGPGVTFEQMPRDALPHLLAGADTLLFPVRWREPWGLVPLEAMAAGTPVVATGRGGSGEYLRDRENCLIFDPDEGPSALAAAVRRLTDDPSLRKRLHEGGVATADALDPRGFEKAVAEELTRVTSNPDR